MTTTAKKSGNGTNGGAQVGEAPDAREHHESYVSNYSQAVGAAAYDMTSGLFGKHDNVRRFWEDQVNRYTLRGFLADLVAHKRRELARVRVIDLGCGSGEGYEILTNVRKRNVSLATKEVDVMPTYLIGAYKGVDLSPAMVGKARENYEGNERMRFEVADLNDGLPVAGGEAPYDIYFSSFGSLSHLEDEGLERVVADVCDHMGETAIFVADMVGRYSYEWQCYWDGPGGDQTNMHSYSMSYIYPPEMLDKVEVETFPLRYWGGHELRDFIDAIAKRCGVEIRRQEMRDRSVLVGRHMNTAEFNRHAQPLREAVSSLHEFNQRTDLDSLLFDYIPHPGHPELNAFFERFQMAWNGVVEACMEALKYADDHEKLREEPSEEYPEAVQDAIRTIRDVVRNVRWFRMGDPLANIVEPQLGYILRNLENDMQEGLGAAHGVLGIFELTRASA